MDFLCAQDLAAMETVFDVPLALPATRLAAAFSYYIEQMPHGGDTYQEDYEKSYWVDRCPGGGKNWDDLGLSSQDLVKLQVSHFSGALLGLGVFIFAAWTQIKKDKVVGAVMHSSNYVANQSTRVAQQGTRVAQQAGLYASRNQVGDVSTQGIALSAVLAAEAAVVEAEEKEAQEEAQGAEAEVRASAAFDALGADAPATAWAKSIQQPDLVGVPRMLPEEMLPRAAFGIDGLTGQGSNGMSHVVASYVMELQLRLDEFKRVLDQIGRNGGHSDALDTMILPQEMTDHVFYQPQVPKQWPMHPHPKDPKAHHHG